MQTSIAAQTAKYPSSSSVLALRARLAWQKVKMKRMDEGLIKDTKGRLADAYHARANKWHGWGEKIEAKVGVGLKCAFMSELNMFLKERPPTLPVIITTLAFERIALWREAVLLSKSAKLLDETKKFAEAGAAWEGAGKIRRNLAIYSSFGANDRRNMKVSGIFFLKASESHSKAGNSDETVRLHGRG